MTDQKTAFERLADLVNTMETTINEYRALQGQIIKEYESLTKNFMNQPTVLLAYIMDTIEGDVFTMEVYDDAQYNDNLVEYVSNIGTILDGVEVGEGFWDLRDQFTSINIDDGLDTNS